MKEPYRLVGSGGFLAEKLVDKHVCCACIECLYMYMCILYMFAIYRYIHT